MNNLVLRKILPLDRLGERKRLAKPQLAKVFRFGVDKPDSMKRKSVSTINLRTQETKGRNSFGHDAFASGLVDRRPSLICDKHLETTLTSRDRSSKSDGASANND